MHGLFTQNLHPSTRVITESSGAAVLRRNLAFAAMRPSAKLNRTQVALLDLTRWFVLALGCACATEALRGSAFSELGELKIGGCQLKIRSDLADRTLWIARMYEALF